MPVNLKNKSLKTVIFDLDGTLIDSSSSIVASFKSAFLSCGITPIKSLNSDIIGPPLVEILEQLSGTSNKKILDNLSAEFKSHYDTYGYKNTIVYPGIVQMLTEVKKSGLKIYIATNKRIYPTQKIINLLKWSDFFEGIYALDSISPPALSKGRLLSTIMKNNNLAKENTVYVGDREDDKTASFFSNIDFIMACWGYDNKEELLDTVNVLSPLDLINKLLNIK
ncbi:HAD family hydrolase [Candidatus Pseudothioglobus singularis]|uniref:Haloacid dehalogenase n=1 Tax=Candidatus Pseudothioglobus singularis PS1 TaxID=1125411 RepID=A0A0M4LQH6_9GAMM|nr:HAD hydrolase-like protein [Candidatus Pseudothioglobus singularis]ALE02297.1 haloacid dehalogenase [Candidatus Pseudothioglobus singularis PS1]